MRTQATAHAMTRATVAARACAVAIGIAFAVAACSDGEQAEPDVSADPSTQPDDSADPSTQPDDSADTSTQPDDSADPTTQPDDSADPTTQPDDSADTSTQPETSSTVEVATADGVHVLAGTTELGDVLVGPDGRTLYGFTNDIDATSTCYGTCAEAWPPVIVPADWTADPELDVGIFATTERDDGQSQLVAGGWPLYYFARDAAPGEVNGQSSGDVWFAVDLDGRLITE